MTGFVNWDQVETEGNGGGEFNDGPKPDYLDFKQPGKYKIRLVGKPFMFGQLFLSAEELGGGKAIPVIGDGNPDPMTSIGKEYKTRCAANVFLRDGDSSVLKVMRCGKIVYSAIAQWAGDAGIDPGGKDGCEFTVVVTGSGLGKKYKVTSLPPSKFTKDEIAKIRESKDDPQPGKGIWDLASVFKPTSHKQMTDIIVKHNLGVISGSDAQMDSPSASEPDFDDGEFGDDDIPF